jgi:hypothetical protein
MAGYIQSGVVKRSNQKSSNARQRKTDSKNAKRRKSSGGAGG